MVNFIHPNRFVSEAILFNTTKLPDGHTNCVSYKNVLRYPSKMTELYRTPVHPMLVRWDSFNKQFPHVNMNIVKGVFCEYKPVEFTESVGIKLVPKTSTYYTTLEPSRVESLSNVDGGQDVIRVEDDDEDDDDNETDLLNTPVLTLPAPSIQPKLPDYNEPDIDTVLYSKLKFNQYDIRFGIDRTSYHGVYKMSYYSPELPIFVPINPVGKTGVYGRGVLNRWGPNKTVRLLIHKQIVLNVCQPNENEDQFIQPISDASSFSNNTADDDDIDKYKQYLVNKSFNGRNIDGNVIVTYGVPLTYVKRNERSVDACTRLYCNIANIKDYDVIKKVRSKIRQFIKCTYKGYIDDTMNTDNAWIECAFLTLNCDELLAEGFPGIESVVAKNGLDVQMWSSLDIMREINCNDKKLIALANSNTLKSLYHTHY